MKFIMTKVNYVCVADFSSNVSKYSSICGAISFTAEHKRSIFTLLSLNSVKYSNISKIAPCRCSSATLGAITSRSFM